MSLVWRRTESPECELTMSTQYPICFCTHGSFGVARFHTGDMGKLDDNGWVHVTGRVKEQYKLDNGKYVVPTPIEDAIGMSRFIDQAAVFGANRPHNVALLVPNWEAVRTELSIESDQVTIDDLVDDKRVRSLLDAEIAAHCIKCKKFEVPKAWAIVAPFTVANNMMTQKLSVRRHNVYDAYSNIVDSLYTGERAQTHQQVRDQRRAA